MCQYPAEEDDNEEDDSPEGRAESPAQTSSFSVEQQQCADGPLQSPQSYQHYPETYTKFANGAAAALPNSEQQIATHSFNSNAPFFQAPPEVHAVGMISPEIVSFPNTSPINVGTEFGHSMMQFEGYMPGELNFMPSSSAPRIAGMVEGGVDWLGLELDSPNNVDIQAPYQNGGTQPAFNQPPISTGMEQALQNRHQQAIAAQLLPVRSGESNGVLALSAESQAVARQWPFDHTINPESQKYRLPPLRDILQDSADNGTLIKSLIHLMSAPYLPEMDLSHDANMMSAMDLLKNSLDLYFSEFHAVLPLVHVPTFQLTKVPTVTLAAMACIGAMYSDDQQGTEQSWSLSEICIQLIAWLVS